MKTEIISKEAVFMFVYSLRASTLKFFGIICVAMAALITLIVFIPVYDGTDDVSASAELNFSKIKTEEDRVAFLKQFGWEVTGAAVEVKETKIPKEFDKVFTTYNELQKRQSLDLAKYKGKAVTRYTYEISNYPDYDGTVYANLIIYKNRVVGGDICTADVEGFIHGFEKLS